MSQVNTEHLKTLGESATNNMKNYDYKEVTKSVLEKFDSPLGRTKDTILIKIPEFTSRCPITGQPDFAEIKINYTPDKYCVESKSLKLYIMSFRNQGEFHESCINRICNDLAELLNPKYISVHGDFTPRGGISINPTARYTQE